MTSLVWKKISIIKNDESSDWATNEFPIEISASSVQMINTNCEIVHFEESRSFYEKVLALSNDIIWKMLTLGNFIHSYFFEKQNRKSLGVIES